MTSAFRKLVQGWPSRTTAGSVGFFHAGSQGPAHTSSRGSKGLPEDTASGQDLEGQQGFQQTEIWDGNTPSQGTGLDKCREAGRAGVQDRMGSD